MRLHGVEYPRRVPGSSEKGEVTRMHNRKSWFVLAAVLPFLVATGCILPIATYIAAKIALKIDSSYGGPPNQGAMVLAVMVCVASIVIGLLLTLAGAYAVVRSTRRPPAASAGPAAGPSRLTAA